MDKTPTPRRARHDGWTPARQQAFIRALIDGQSIMGAAKLVGMSASTAYRLRNHPAATAFRAAWDAAVAPAIFDPGPGPLDAALALEIGAYSFDGLDCTRSRPISAAQLIILLDRGVAKIQKLQKTGLS